MLTTVLVAIALYAIWPLRPRITLAPRKHVTSLSFSPDGRMLLVVPWVSRSDEPRSDEGFLHDVDSGREVAHFRRSNANFPQSAWMPDGRLAYVGTDGSLEFFDPFTNRAETGPYSGFRTPTALTVSSDGTRIATIPALSNPDRCAHVCDLATGKLRLRLDPGEKWESRFDDVKLSTNRSIVGTISHTFHELTVIDLGKLQMENLDLQFWRSCIPRGGVRPRFERRGLWETRSSGHHPRPQDR